MAFSIFCLRLVHQNYFTLVLCLSAIWVFLQSLGVVESFFFFLHHFLFSKNPRTFAYHHALHFALCIVLALDRFALEYQLGLHIGNLHSSFEEELCISRSSIPCFHGHNAFALIVRCAFYFMLHHNSISCTIISFFFSNKAN